ncbi:MAG: PaaI family thioesterase [Alphaproteobacteria bacterium]|nr:PaaI family thioesterase [Alphaproteobacteria bacterium]
MDAAERLNAEPLPFAKLLGLRVVAAAPEAVVAELTVREELCTRPAVMHGGAMMALADTLGAIGTMLNVPPGHGTTTIESKTNFVAAAPAGTLVTATCTPVHRGKRTQIWQTRLTDPKGKLLALVTQTQMVLEPR